MSKSSTKETVYTIQLPVRNTCRVINFRKTPSYKETFFITGINEKEYDDILKNHNISITRDNCKFDVEEDDILCYGNIDFHNGSTDSVVLDTFNWLDNLGIQGVSIPANYNYDKHECTTKLKSLMWTETFKNSVLCRYLHGCIGKPELTLIFRQAK